MGSGASCPPAPRRSQAAARSTAVSRAPDVAKLAKRAHGSAGGLADASTTSLGKEIYRNRGPGLMFSYGELDDEKRREVDSMIITLESHLGKVAECE